MTIQWFPGHMAKARREVSEKMKYVDIVFELVDARLPLSSRNPMLDQIIQQKPRLVLLNKADLADPQQTKLWQEYFRKQGHLALAITAQESKGIKGLVPAAKEALKEKRARDAAGGSSLALLGNGLRYSKCWEIYVDESTSRQENCTDRK